MGLNLSAQCYLRAFADGIAITGGLVHEEALRALSLDFSLDSLARIDQFLDRELASSPVLARQLLEHSGVQNCVFLLGFHAGEVVARALGEQPVWDVDEDRCARDPVPVALQAFAGRAVARFSSHGDFAPLSAILERLFGGESGLSASARTLLQTAGVHVAPDLPLPAVPAASWPLGQAGVRPVVTAAQLEALRPLLPFWMKRDDEPLGRLFDHVDELLCAGRVVWGALVQANNLLFEPELQGGAPGDVLYDPHGRVEPEALSEIAHLLMQGKSHGTDGIDDPALARYVVHLRDEHTRQFGFVIAGRMLPYPVCASTTYFDQCQLPDGMLSQRWLPLLISDTQPGLVLPLPQALWPTGLREEWLAAGEARIGRRFDPRAEHARRVAEFERERADPEPLFREGLRHFFGNGVPRDYRKARELWERAAKTGRGHALALNNLGIMYEQGLGVPVDADRQLAYYTASAQLGEPEGKCNLGRHLLLVRGRLDEAIPYLEAAAAAGVAAAREQLQYIAEARARKAPARGLLSQLLSLLRR